MPIKILVTVVIILISKSAISNPSIQDYLEKQVNLKSARAVCGDIPIIDIDGQLACEICPNFIVRALSEPLVLQKMVLGKFSSSDRQEVVVDTEGCEPHSNNFGGMVLLENRPDELLIRYYQPGFRLHDCIKLESLRDRDILVCNQIYQGQGNTIGQFAAFRFGEKEATWQNLQSWIYSEENEIYIKPSAAALEDLNNDGIQDLRLSFNSKSPNTATKAISINYLFDGQNFFLSPESETNKRELNELYQLLN